MNEAAAIDQSIRAPRSGGMDLLRVAAAVLVVLLHAAVPYLEEPIAGLVWPVRERPSSVAHWVGWASLLVVMPIFLLLAGYFSAASLTRQSGGSFLRQRFGRLIVPLCYLGPPILAADLYIWLTGWVIEGRIAPRKLQSLTFGAGQDDGLWGLGHLWFLQYVFLYSMLLAAAVHLPGRNSAHHEPAYRERSKRTISRGIALAMLWAASIGIACLAPAVVFGFQHAWLPVPSKWLFCGCFFAGGCILFQVTAWRPRAGRMPNESLPAGHHDWTRTWPWLVAAGCLCVILSERWLEVALAADSYPWGFRLGIALLGASAGWCFALGLCFAALRWPFASGPRLRYLAAASFWVYLVHHPLVGLSHVALKAGFGEMLPPTAKYLLTATIGLLVPLLSFHIVARRRPLAGPLGIPASLRTMSVEASDSAEPTPPRVAA